MAEMSYPGDGVLRFFHTSTPPPPPPPPTTGLDFSLVEGRVVGFGAAVLLLVFYAVKYGIKWLKAKQAEQQATTRRLKPNLIDL